jgi:hypothetical protein
MSKKEKKDKSEKGKLVNVPTSTGSRTYYSEYEDDDDDIYSHKVKSTPYRDSSIGFKPSYTQDPYYSSYNYSGYGYGYGYGGRSYYDSYDYKPKSWSWNTWWSDDDDEENPDLMIKVCEGYSTPNAYELKRRLGYNTSADMLDFAQELCRFFYLKLIDDKDYFSEAYKDESLIRADQLDGFLHKKELFEKFWETDIPGWTPKEKALYVIEELSRANGKCGTVELQDLNPESVDKIKICRDDFWDPIYNEMLDDFDLEKRGMNKLSVLRKVSLIREFGGKFKIEKEIEEKQVANSNIHAKRMMRDFSQIYNLELYQRLFPNFKQKLATKDLIVNTPIDKTEHKQKIIMLVDYSGSMAEVYKQEWVVAILLERLKHVIKEECEIYFSFFLHGEYKLNFHHLYDRKSALEFWNKFSTRPSGGDTELGVIVDKIGKEIKEGKLFNLNLDLSKEQPEILAINDGQDSVKTGSFSYKTNAINLLQMNDEVKNLCVKNNGVHVHIDLGNNFHVTDK